MTPTQIRAVPSGIQPQSNSIMWLSLMSCLCALGTPQVRGWSRKGAFSQEQELTLVANIEY